MHWFGHPAPRILLTDLPILKLPLPLTALSSNVVAYCRLRYCQRTGDELDCGLHQKPTNFMCISQGYGLLPDCGVRVGLCRMQSQIFVAGVRIYDSGANKRNRCMHNFELLRFVGRSPKCLELECQYIVSQG